jgi:hypothetical protein
MAQTPYRKYDEKIISKRKRAEAKRKIDEELKPHLVLLFFFFFLIMRVINYFLKLCRAICLNPNLRGQKNALIPKIF